MQAEVALAGYGHAQRPMRKHLYAHQLPARAFDALAHYRVVDAFHLVQIQLPREHDHVGELRVEAKGLGVGYGQLGGDMNLHPYAACVGDCRHVGGDNGRHACLVGGVERDAHLIQVFGIQHYVEREVGFDSSLTADAHHFVQVLRSEVVGGMAAHIQPSDSEIYRICPSLYSGTQALEIACRGHYFQFFPVHSAHSFLCKLHLFSCAGSFCFPVQAACVLLRRLPKGCHLQSRALIYEEFYVLLGFNRTLL